MFVFFQENPAAKRQILQDGVQWDLVLYRMHAGLQLNSHLPFLGSRSLEYIEFDPGMVCSKQRDRWESHGNYRAFSGASPATFRTVADCSYRDSSGSLYYPDGGGEYFGLAGVYC